MGSVGYHGTGHVLIRTGDPRYAFLLSEAKPSEKTYAFAFKAGTAVGSSYSYKIAFALQMVEKHSGFRSIGIVRAAAAAGGPQAAHSSSADGRDGCLGAVCVTHARPRDGFVDGRR